MKTAQIEKVLVKLQLNIFPMALLAMVLKLCTNGEASDVVYQNT